MVEQQEIQEKYIELQFIAQQMQAVQQQVSAMEEQSQEINSVIASLASLLNAKKGSKTLVPVSEGLFVQGTIENTEELMVNVGSNVVVRKSIPDTQSLLNERVRELETHNQKMRARLAELVAKAQQLESQLQRMMESG
ncbi:prefoldin subunit alpha [Candidatus Woesearchaeota archaeon]|nr:prefoldin subunit alpha [Candidatus Woesearchaeota archaeon]